MGKYFGTDGIRGVAGKELDFSLSYRTGFAAGVLLSERLGKAPTVCMGRDTRISGTFIEAALSAGLCAAGAEVCLYGVLPTPAIAHLTVKNGYDLGVMISASHNPYEHNGIKLFSRAGDKLSDEWQDTIELYIDNPPRVIKTGGEIGTIRREADSFSYIQHVQSCAPGELSGVRVLIDCANGAASDTAKPIFEGLGADCTVVFCHPDGININEGCGSTDMGPLAEQVRAGGYDIGIAFDGDADRCLAVDERGQTINGDVILGLLSSALLERGELKGGVAATIVSNLGLKRYLQGRGVDMCETLVGDRYVLEAMRKNGYNLGGEQSGHVILSDHATTGDGQLTAVYLLWVLKQSGKKASQLCAQVRMYPQITRNVAVPGHLKSHILEHELVLAAEEQAAKRLGQEGRVLLRPSGTESVVRIMVEGPETGMIETLVDDMAEVINRVAGDDRKQ